VTGLSGRGPEKKKVSQTPKERSFLHGEKSVEKRGGGGGGQKHLGPRANLNEVRGGFRERGNTHNLGGEKKIEIH